MTSFEIELFSRRPPSIYSEYMVREPSRPSVANARGFFYISLKPAHSEYEAATGTPPASDLLENSSTRVIHIALNMN